MKKVLLIFGGNSTEHDISCLSAKSILENIDYSKFDVTKVGITKYNEWFVYEDIVDNLDNNWYTKKITKIYNIIDYIQKFDIVFPIIHGNNGEDGKLQGMLELFDINYVGCKTLSSSVGMDKDFSKMIFSYLEIPQLPFITITRDYNIKEVIKEIKFPLIVKPCNGGSSIGISKASNKKQLKKAIDYALNFDDKVVIETFINARELECAIVSKNKLICSDVGEIIPANEFYDFDAKYNNSRSLTIIPAEIPMDIKNKIKMYAKKAFIGINAKDYARIDFFYDERENKIYINEINTIPGFTTISMFPQLMIDKGFSYQSLITYLLDS